MLTHKLPYADIDDIDALKASMCSLNHLILPKEANKLPRGFKKALGAMLQVDPELRPSIEQVLLLIRDSDISADFSSGIHVQDINKKVITTDKSTPTINHRRRLSLSPPPVNFQTSAATTQLDENTRISLALLMVS